MNQILNYRLALVLAEKAQNSEMKYQISVCTSFVYCVIGRLLSADKEKALGVAQCIVVWPHCFEPCGEVTHGDGITW